MLERSIYQILRKKVSLQAASRTDSGVHAERQVVNFFSDTPLDLRRFLHGLNGTLPQDIRVLSVEEMPLDFHPTLHAKGKRYTYWICNTPTQLPFYRNLSWHFPYPCDLDKMRKGAENLLGTHDFSSFCNERTLWTRSPICTLQSIDIQRINQRISVTIEGDHFLYKMVRNLVGTLAYIGCGKIDLSDIPLILSSQKRNRAGITAPAQGLFLARVFYG